MRSRRPAKHKALIPRRIKLGPDVRVFALNNAGIYNINIRLTDGYNNPTEVAPLFASWDKVASEELVPQRYFSIFL